MKSLGIHLSFVLLTMTGAFLPVHANAGTHYQSNTYDAYILNAASIYRVRPEFVKAVILVESAGKPDAKSHKGAIGLMQVMPFHADRLGFKRQYLYDPRINIMVGTWYLRKMLNMFNGDPILALAAYNAGPQKVKKHKGVPPYRETREYIRKVLWYYALATSQKKS